MYSLASACLHSRKKILKNLKKPKLQRQPHSCSAANAWSIKGRFLQNAAASTCEQPVNRGNKKTGRHADFATDSSSEVSQPGVECLVDISFEKLVRGGESERLGRLSDYEREQCGSDKQALTSQTGSLKCFMFEAS